jgi:NADH-quinone oxidoreductase subunit C
MPSSLEASPLLQKVRAFDPEGVEDAQAFRGEVTFLIRRKSLLRVCEYLRDLPGVSFKFLADLTAVDQYPTEPRFELVYHLLSLESSERLRLKVRVSGDDPRLDSVVPVWPAANAFEREVFDLFGIRFEGHPDLRRILMPEDWEGHPLRKDYPVQGDITRCP